jgi:type VI secretion system secreted protein Hcp
VNTVTDQQSAGASRRDLFKLGAFGLGAGASAAMFPAFAAAAPGDDLPVPDTSWDYFLKIGTIQGDSLDERYPKWIPLLSWDWGASVAVSTAGGGGASVGKAKPKPYKFLCYTGKHTPPMFTQLTHGSAVGTVKFAAQAPELGFAPWKLEFAKAFLTDYENFPFTQNGSPLDMAQFEYQKVSMTYTPQGIDGQAGTPITSAFDFAAQR